MDIERYMHTIGKRAYAASRIVAIADTGTKNQALHAIADDVLQNEDALTIANCKDLDAGKMEGLAPALLDRLELTRARIEAMAEGLRQVAALEDTVGKISELAPRPNGMRIGQMQVPLGVIGIIYESRPSVTADAAGLCLKSGNAVILRGGSEALNSNQAIAACIQTGLKSAGLPEDAVQVINVADRATVGRLLAMPEYVDVIIPRGGQSLIERVSAEARMPVIKHLAGICHVYIDADADLDKAVNIAFNAKTQRYGTCNTMECLLLAEDMAEAVLAKLAPMYRRAGVEIRGCEQARKILPDISLATEEDYRTEYLGPILSLRIVADIDMAISHIDRFGSHHTDAIITEDSSKADRFLREVDSSSVMVNVSTRLADGFEYGLGAEIGISTDKFHARGPVGLAGLGSKKYVVVGDGQIRQ